jgi:hypothetical protein
MFSGGKPRACSFLFPMIYRLWYFALWFGGATRLVKPSLPIHKVDFRTAIKRDPGMEGVVLRFAR